LQAHGDGAEDLADFEEPLLRPVLKTESWRVRRSLPHLGQEIASPFERTSFS